MRALAMHLCMAALGLAPAGVLAQAPADSVSAPPAVRFPVTLASFSTTLLGSLPARTANIRLAVEALDGHVLEPGERLSFNSAVGPRTAARGFQDAPVILHERRQIQIGGGICQAATTLFVAALDAGLTPTERWRHSSPVDYIAAGQDATIAWGAKDLALRNDLAQSVQVRAEVLGQTLLVRILGERPGDAQYELDTETQELPGEPGLVPGREITLWRVRREDGAEVAREFVHRDVLPPSRGARPGEGR